MPTVPWTSGGQRPFVEDNLPVYDTAVKEGKKAIRRFWSTVIGEFFEKFPLKEELVTTGKLGPHVRGDNYEMTPAETEIFANAMESRSQQIKTLFRYLHKKAYGEVPRPVACGSSNKAISAAAKTFVAKQRRCHHRSEIFYRLNQDWLDPLIETEMSAFRAHGGGPVAEDEEEQTGLVVGEDGKLIEESSVEKANRAEAKKKGWNLQVRNDVIKRNLELASEDDKRAVAEAIIQEKEEMDRAADMDRSGRGLARDAELRAEALDRINTFMVENAKLYWEHAAMTTITIGVAPDPQNPEKMKSRVVAYGQDANGRLVTDVDPTLAGKIVKQLRSWSKTSLFTPERFAAALAEKEERIIKLEEEQSNDLGPKKEQREVESEADDEPPKNVDHVAKNVDKPVKEPATSKARTHPTGTAKAVPPPATANPAPPPIDRPVPPPVNKPIAGGPAAGEAKLVKPRARPVVPIEKANLASSATSLPAPPTAPAVINVERCKYDPL